MVTGYDEAIAVYHDHGDVLVLQHRGGPFVPFPVPLEGDDISAIIEEHRDELPFSDQLPVVRPARSTPTTAGC